MITKQCKLCNQNFNTKNPRKIFCCKQHKDTYGRIKTGEYKNYYVPGKRNCLECGQEFEISKFNPTQEYCSQNCRTKKNKRIYPKPEQRQQKQCIVCGKTFAPINICQPFQKYCSPKCRNSVRDKNNYYKHHEQKLKKVKIYYSTEHGKEIRRENAKISGYKRRAKLEKGDLTREQLKEIKTKYNCCVFCEKETKLTNDHIISIDENGENTKYNITRSCRSCNSSRQERDVFLWCEQKGFKVSDIIIFLLKKQQEEHRHITDSVKNNLEKIMIQ